MKRNYRVSLTNSKITRLALMISSLGFSSLLFAVHEPRMEDAGEAPAYEVNCADGATNASQCEVNKETYIGWRTFATDCQVCHGGSALGSTFAPNLLNRFNDEGVDYARFKYAVTHGYTGHIGAMPAWEKNPGVMKHLDNLYRYLKARADGSLPEGRPKRMKKKKEAASGSESTTSSTITNVSGADTTPVTNMTEKSVK